MNSCVRYVTKLKGVPKMPGTFVGFMANIINGCPFRRYARKVERERVLKRG